MTGYLLDTNVVSELRKPKPHGAVVAWLSRLNAGQLFLSAITLGKMQTGVERTRRQDPAKAREIEIWIESLEQAHQVLSMDAACCREWGRLVDRRPDDLIEDAMIAATARVHGLIVATRNERHFRQLDVELVNPFRSS